MPKRPTSLGVLAPDAATNSDRSLTRLAGPSLREVDGGIAEDQVFTLVTLRLLPGYLPHLGLSKRVLSFFQLFLDRGGRRAKIDLAE